MKPIENEIARLKLMALAIAIAFPESEPANTLANRTIPNIEKLRALADKEIQEGGLTPETHDAISAAMTGGETEAWKLERDFQHPTTKLVCRQFDNLHIQMNAIAGGGGQESVKCWPPGSEPC